VQLRKCVDVFEYVQVYEGEWVNVQAMNEFANSIVSKYKGVLTIISIRTIKKKIPQIQASVLCMIT
jgi:hypothetical protein